jgi:UDP-2,3-diacylglucosamine hydrolase
MRSQLSSGPASPATKASSPVALFVSDVHLQESHPRTTDAFLAFLHGHAIQARQLYLLGDLFEYWAGDDDLISPFNQRISEALRRVADSGVALFWISGNRDFLVGDAFARATGATLLPDPYVATIAHRQVLLVHGDAQCTDDVAYMGFRELVRQQGWQQAFLAQPLAERKKIIEGMRMESREAQRDKPAEIMDVNPLAIDSLFDATATSLMIHGHTHRPARHEYRHNARNRVRYVLPDWDCDVEPVRGGWLAMYADGSIKRFSAEGALTGE